MDPLGVVCLLLIAIAIVALVVLHKKQSYTGTFETRAEESTEELVKEQMEETPAQHCDQKTIYEFIQPGVVRICPGCDGENRSTDCVCVICGQDLTKEGA